MADTADTPDTSASDPSELVTLLGLQPHVEGGWFRLGLHGRRVLVLEAGAAGPGSHEPPADPLTTYLTAAAKVPGSPYRAHPAAPWPEVTDLVGTDGTPGFRAAGHLRQDGPLPYASGYVRVNGGTGNVWTGLAPRMLPEDFDTESFGYGRRWPLTYDDLERHYRAAEEELEVAGDADEQRTHVGLPLTDSYVFPMRALPPSRVDRTSALLVSGERTLAAEFPTEVQARTVLGAIGHGERTFTLIGRAAGGLNPGSVTRSLELLTSRRIVAADLPLSTRPSRETRYRIDDPYLRFRLSFIGPGIPAVERGRGDRVLEAIRTSWTSWRGRAVEPGIRESLWRLADDHLPEGTNTVGGYWTRTNDPEIDIIGADRAPIAKNITLVGSIKWLENKPFDHRDLARLITHRSQLPGADDDTPLLAVARSGCTAECITHLTPTDLLTAWPTT